MRRPAIFLVLALAGCDATLGSNDEIGDDTGESGTASESETDTAGESESGVPADCEPFALSMDGCPSNAICMDDDPDP